ncbi:hypothetical protein SAMN05518669_11318 [Variovorax sp. YR634]|nr:hypothetical protein SAMN05518669_11318 [Variovorax sp. YR634]
MNGVQSCADLDRATEGLPDRVGSFADAKPSCACEQETLSEYSPGLVQDEETIIRMVCVPMHVHSKRAELKSSFFSHVATFGASVQRLEFASDGELIGCVEALVGGGEDRMWLGYVEAPASLIRSVQLGDGDTQSFCVADAALPENPAHAEIHCAQRIPEADHVEYRAELLRVFNERGVLHRRSIRGGDVWNGVREELRLRPLPQQWAALA